MVAALSSLTWSLSLLIQVHRHPRPLVGQGDALDVADRDAAHFHDVAHLEFLDVFEEGVQVVAP